MTAFSDSEPVAPLTLSKSLDIKRRSRGGQVLGGALARCAARESRRRSEWRELASSGIFPQVMSCPDGHRRALSFTPPSVRPPPSRIPRSPCASCPDAAQPMRSAKRGDSVASACLGQSLTPTCAAQWPSIPSRSSPSPPPPSVTPPPTSSASSSVRLRVFVIVFSPASLSLADSRR